MDQKWTSDICKEKSNSVEIRQSHDLRFDKCVENPVERSRNQENSSNSDEKEIAELRTVCLIYKLLSQKKSKQTQELKRGRKSKF